MENPTELLSEQNTLLIIDMQQDFSPEGALPVANFHTIVPRINRILGDFDLVVATQDWHPANHCSFYTQHAGAHAFEVREVAGISQTLWPVHCVAGTEGAELDNQLDKSHIDTLFKKGTTVDKDAYSAFHLNDRSQTTGLEKILPPGQHRLFICGVATDVCVLHTVLSASELNYGVTVLEDLCAGLNGAAHAIEQMAKLPHVRVAKSANIQPLLLRS